MRPIALLLAACLLPLTVLAAETTVGDCAQARDPARCEARQAAIKACADLRGAEKRACLDAALPPPDCTRARDPARCEAAEKAKQACKGKSGKALKACLRDDPPKKKKKLPARASSKAN